MNTFTRLFAASVIGIAALLVANDGWSRWANVTTPVPVDRLVKNVESYIEENPKEARGYYVLGRLHSLAFAKQSDTLRVVQRKDQPLPDFAPWETIMVKLIRDENALTEAVLKHLKGSVENYRKATELDKDTSLPFLGLAWTLEEGAKWAGRAEPLIGEEKPEKPITEAERSRFKGLIKKLGAENAAERDEATEKLRSEISRSAWVLKEARDTQKDREIRTRINAILSGHWNTLWKTAALEAYRRAHALALKGDLKKRGAGPRADSLISLEAGQGIIRILKGKEMSEKEKKEIGRIEDSIRELRKKGRAMTPIIFPLDRATPLDGLLATNTSVLFDMDGDGEPSRWPWVRPETGLLVWDPARTGRVESGLQLFGSVTWWIFWDDGYQPLDLLDDDRSGRLSGRELAGLAVWRDANSNGVSEPGEVLPVEALGIRSIEVRAAGRVDGVPFHPRGITLSDGTAVPTYDWTPVRISRH